MYDCCLDDDGEAGAAEAVIDDDVDDIEDNIVEPVADATVVADFVDSNDCCCELNSELDTVVACCGCCCCGHDGSSVNRKAISKSRKTSVSLDSIKLKRLKMK